MDPFLLIADCSGALVMILIGWLIVAEIRKRAFKDGVRFADEQWKSRVDDLIALREPKS